MGVGEEGEEEGEGVEPHLHHQLQVGEVAHRPPQQGEELHQQAPPLLSEENAGTAE